MWGESAPFPVQAGSARLIEIPLTVPIGCGTPTTIATMAAVVEGPIEVASRRPGRCPMYSLPEVAHEGGPT
jgi:hypothetical protein